jgi:hypothetical protein
VAAALRSLRELTATRLLRWHTRRREETARKKRAPTRLLRCHTRWRPWEHQACIATAASEARIAAAALRSLREATGRRKRTATRLLRCRTRWCSWERPESILAAAPRRGRDATATRLLRLNTRWRPWERRARRQRGFTASGEVIENYAAARSSLGSVKIK